MKRNTKIPCVTFDFLSILFRGLVYCFFVLVPYTKESNIKKHSDKKANKKIELPLSSSFL
ncbi:hypothetical protein J41TS2_09160 [Bacillus sonorensis]|nr:hypothetical protein J41TS2_09160 [Bacillus sonorensis]